jgi:outer membrane protein OmpA-like peptidoglycan-associated protein
MRRVGVSRWCAMAQPTAVLIAAFAVFSATAFAGQVPRLPRIDPVRATLIASSPDYYAQALKEYDAGNFAGAERLFEQSIEAEPEGPHATESRRYLGQLYTRAGSSKAPAAVGPADVAGGADSNGTLSAGQDADGASPPITPRGPRGEPLAANPADQFLNEAGDRVFFGAGSAELGGRARTVLAAQAAWLQKRPDWRVTIEGHADDPPLSESELEDLSEVRAKAVRDRLVTEGISADRITIVPWGHLVPVATCVDALCQAQNRRAVTVLTPLRPAGQANNSLGIPNNSLGIPKKPASSSAAPITASKDIRDPLER